ncbi:MAG: hypothetical protein ACKOBQ_02655 [Bacteroidota bacterium]
MNPYFEFPASWKRPASTVFVLSTAAALFWLIAGAPDGGLIWLRGSAPALVYGEPFGPAYDGPAWVANNYTDELMLSVITLSGVLTGFAKEPVEDELIRQIRWKALANATVLSTLFLLLATWTVYGIAFFYVLYVQTVALLVVFNTQLAWSLRRFYSAQHEE